MKKIHFLIALVCFGFSVNAQINLVPNPSFEDTASFCPNNSGQILRAKNWFRTNGSPDYFHSCYNGVSNQFSVPINSYGYQQPNNISCNAYAGIFTAAPNFNNANETFATKLNDSLIKNTKYFVALYVSLANVVKYSSNNIGVFFSTKVPGITLNASPSGFCQINFNQNISDSLQWVKLFTSFVADSNYKYFSVGNFKDSSMTIKQVYNNTGLPSSYYLIDDVCLSNDSSFAYNYSYNCTLTSIYKNQNNNEFKIFPNPIISDLTISTTYEDVYSISIINSFGKEITSSKSLFGNKKLNTENYNNGIYILKIFDRNNNILANLKLIILNP